MLTPTRELCIQVTQALRTYGAHSGIDVVAVFGGAPIRSQQAQLRAGGHVVVGTVGRVLDLISRHSLMLHDCRFVVLDEADEMLDLGFLEDVERILALTPSSRQTALFSATMPPPIRELADRYMYDPITVQVEAATLTIDTVAQFQLPVDAKRQAGQAGGGAAGRETRPGDRVRAHQDPRRPAVPDAARRRPERAGAARRHDPGLPRRGDAGLQGRSGSRSWSPPTSPPAAWTSRPSPTSSTTTSRPRPTPTSTASAAPGGWAARAGRSRSWSPARSASWRRSNATSAPRSRSGSAGVAGAADAGAGAPPAPLQAARLARRRRRGLRQAGARGGALGGAQVADIVVRGHLRHRPRRRGGPRRAGARPLRLPVGPGRRRPNA